MPACLEWAEQRSEECSETEDQGYNECDDWDRRCCDWWPCSWACKVITWVCVGYTWVSNIVCVAWDVVTTTVCVLWDIATTFINAILVTLESTLGWILSAVAFIVELLEMIPVLGTLIRWILNFVSFLLWTVASLIDAGLGYIGIRPEKLLRVCTIILRDEASDAEGDERGTPVASVDTVRVWLQLAADVYKRDANVRLIPSRPFKYTTGFADAEQVTDDWIQIDSDPGDSDTLDVACNAPGAGADWLLTGTKYQAKASTRCFYGAWRRVLGYGAPVTCFVIRDIPGNAVGCCLWITDYATIEAGGATPRTVAHELGHACNLWHLCVDDDRRNLMATQNECSPQSTTPPNTANPRLSDWQVLLVRASKHVTYF